MLQALYVACAVVGLFALIRLSLHYIEFPSFFDHGEPNVALRSWRVAQGLPAYMQPDAPDFLLTLYGPLSYAWNALVLWLAGPGIAQAKFGGIAAMAISLGAMSFHVWRRYGAAWVAPGIALAATGLLMGVPFAIWTRADPVTIMMAALGLAATCEFAKSAKSWWLAALSLGLFTGLAMNGKAHAFLFLAPLAFAYASRKWMLAWPLAAITAGLAWYAPFLHPAFPMELYVEGLSKAVGVRGIEPDLLFQAIKRLSPFMAPLLLLPWAWRHLPIQEKLYALCYGACVIVGLYPASVAGSGWYQMLALAPMAVDVSLLLASKSKNGKAGYVVLAIVAMALALGWPQQRRLNKYMDERAWMGEAAAEISGYAERHPEQKIEMGFGQDVAETYRTTFMKPMLAFKGNPTTFDGWSDMEAAFIGLPPSSVKRESLAACATPLWLIPAGEPPFTMPSVFLNQDFLFAYRLVFLERYELKEKGRYFDLWGCRGG